MILYKLSGGKGGVLPRDTDWKQLCLGRVRLPCFHRKYAAGVWMRVDLQVFHRVPGGIQVSGQLARRDARQIGQTRRFHEQGPTWVFTGPRLYYLLTTVTVTTRRKRLNHSPSASVWSDGVLVLEQDRVMKPSTFKRLHNVSAYPLQNFNLSVGKSEWHMTCCCLVQAANSIQVEQFRRCGFSGGTAGHQWSITACVPVLL